MKTHRKQFLMLLVLAILGAAFFISVPLKANESADFITEEESVPGQVQNESPPRSSDAFDRIEQAMAGKEITLKDAVLLKAKLLFDEQAAVSDFESEVLSGHTDVREPCLTGFYKDVHRVFDHLSDSEKEYLASLDENLRAIIHTRQRKLAGTQAMAGDSTNALPIYANLAKKVEGIHCTVNFTDTPGDPDTTTQAYAELVKVYIDMAYAAETKKFRAALAEPGGTDNKLQIYVVNMPGGTLGTWVGLSIVAGKQMSGYITISKDLEAQGGSSWQVLLKGTCFHEYFHGVQFAYNWASSEWFQEGTARWAETYYGKNWDILINTFAAGDSLFNQPLWPIWWSTFHKYSTVALAYYFADKYGKDNFILSYLNMTEGEDDAVKALTAAVAAQGKVFGDEFKEFWIAMYYKNIRSIKKYMPNVVEGTCSSYGVVGTKPIYQLGAVFHHLEPMEGLKNTALIYNYKPATGENVEAFKLINKSKKREDIDPATDSDDNYHYVPKFGSGVKNVLIVYTDVTYEGEDSTERNFTYRYLQPYIKINTVTVLQPEIPQYSYSHMVFNYDLLGTIAGEKFSTQVKYTEKGSPEFVSGEYNFQVGKDQNFYNYFYSGSAAPGTYKYSVDFSVPGDSWKNKWGTPQNKSSGKYSVKVANASASSRRNTGSKQSFPLVTVAPIK
jgi:hypothetical protein